MDVYNLIIKFMSVLDGGEEEFDHRFYLVMKIQEYAKYDQSLIDVAQRLYNCLCLKYKIR